MLWTVLQRAYSLVNGQDGEREQGKAEGRKSDSDVRHEIK